MRLETVPPNSRDRWGLDPDGIQTERPRYVTLAWISLLLEGIPGLLQPAILSLDYRQDPD